MLIYIYITHIARKAIVIQFFHNELICKFVIVVNICELSKKIRYLTFMPSANITKKKMK